MTNKSTMKDGIFEQIMYPTKVGLNHLNIAWNLPQISQPAQNAHNIT